MFSGIRLATVLCFLLMQVRAVAGFSPSDLDSLCAYADAARWNGCFRYLAGIWENIPPEELSAAQCGEARFWLMAMESADAGMQGGARSLLLSVGPETEADRVNEQFLQHYSHSCNWSAWVTTLNRIWKQCTDSSFRAKNSHEGVNRLVSGQRSGIPDSSLRQGYMYLAHRYKRMNDLRAALRWYQVAHALVDDKFCLDLWSWYVENDLANLYNRLGDLEEALYYHNLLVNSLSYFNKNEWLSRECINVSKLYISMEQPDRALEIAHKGLNAARSQSLGQGVLANAIQVAEVLLEKDSLRDVVYWIDLAAQCKGRALADKAAENQYLIHKAYATYFSKLKRPAEADIHFASADSCMVVARRSSNVFLARDRAKLYNEWGKMHLDQGDELCCREKLITGLGQLWAMPDSLELEAPLDSVMDDITYAELFSTISDYYDHRYTREKDANLLKHSLRYLQWALFGCAQIQQRIAADPSKLTIIRDNRELADRGVERLYEWQQTGTSAEKLFPLVRAFLTAAKGRLLREKAEAYSQVQRFDPEDQLRFQQLQEQAWWWMEQRSKTNHEDAFIRSELLKIKRAKSRMLSGRQERSSMMVYPANYLEYHLSAEAVFVAGRIGGTTLFRRLGSRSALDSLMANCQRAFTATEAFDYRTALKSMAAFLLPDEGKSLPAQLCIIPDGGLQQFPFEALILPGGKYLLETCRIWYEHAYGSLREEAVSSEKNERLLVIWPQYPPAPEIHLLAQRGNEYALPYTLLEVEGIRKVMGVKTIIDTSGNAGHLLHSMQKADMLHYAGHARSEGSEAYLILPRTNERLSLEELAEFYHPMQLVVLSACETGLGAWELGEGLRSLGKSFREAGARSVVMSLWAVNDQSTASIMTTFYQTMTLGHSKAEALRTAKLHYLHQSGFEKSHPYFWAGFVGYGEGE